MTWSVALQRNPFAESVKKSQVIVQTTFIRIIPKLIQHSGMVDYAYFMCPAMGYVDVLLITGNPPHTGSAPVGFVHQYGSFKFLLFYVDDTESTCIHPPLL